METIQICGHPFVGPFYDLSKLPSIAGVYAPIDHRPTGYWLLDVGQSEDLRGRVSAHDRASSWHINCAGLLGVWIHPMPGSSAARRMLVESMIRTRYNPPCGDR